MHAQDSGVKETLTGAKQLGDELGASVTREWGAGAPPVARLVVYGVSLMGVLLLLRAKDSSEGDSANVATASAGNGGARAGSPGANGGAKAGGKEDVSEEMARAVVATIRTATTTNPSAAVEGRSSPSNTRPDAPAPSPPPPPPGMVMPKIKKASGASTSGVFAWLPNIDGAKKPSAGSGGPNGGRDKPPAASANQLVAASAPQLQPLVIEPSAPRALTAEEMAAEAVREEVCQG